MYCPYLRGKKFEMLAIKELTLNNKLSNSILPIIEPVNINNSFLKSFKTIVSSGKRIGFVLNPKVGNYIECLKFAGKTVKDDLDALVNNNNVYKTLIVEKDINSLINEYKVDISKTIFIIDNQSDVDDFVNSIHVDSAFLIIVLNKYIKRFTNKNNCVILQDQFKKQARNSDYIINDVEFSNAHLTFKNEGYCGYSDYSLIGSEYMAVGGSPLCVAIHIVYFNKNDVLCIHHFLSDSNDSKSDQAGKFSEAVHKLVEWNKNMKISTIAISQFQNYFKCQHNPGLGTIKKLSIMNHLELINDYFENK